MFENIKEKDTFTVYNLIPYSIALVDLKSGKIKKYNNAFKNLSSIKELISKKMNFFDFFSLDKKDLQENKKIISKKQTSKNTNYYKIDFTFFNEDEILVYIDDVTAEQEKNILYEDNEKLLQYITIEESLNKTLNKIVSFAQNRMANVKCSILLLDEEGKHLLNGAAPSLPKFYNDAINGVKIGDKIGSCGSAAFNKKRVIVEDISTHENWTKFKEIAKRANLSSCWSEPIFSSNKKVLGTFAIYNDVTKTPNKFEIKLISLYANIASIAIEKDQNFKKLKESKEQIENIFENAAIALLYMSKDRVFIRTNLTAAKTFGFKTQDEMVGLDARKLHLSEKNYKEFGEKYINIIKQGKTFTYDYPLKKFDGSLIWCELNCKALDNNIPSDLNKGILWSVKDITQRKEREEELKRLNTLANDLSSNQKTLLSLFDKGDSVLFNFRNDSSWSVDYVSKSVEKLLSYSTNNFISKDIYYMDCIYEEDKKRFLKETHDAIKNNLDYFRHEPYRIVTKKGEIKWVLNDTVTKKNTDGKIINFIGYLTDITSQIKNQEIIYQQSKIASMGEMLGNISHQWRQPLSAISTLATGAQLKKEINILSDEDFDKTMETINNQAQYLSNTIDDFRNFFVKDTKNKTNINLKNSLKKSFSLIKDSYRSLNIETIINMEDAPIVCNENLFMQAILNILNNSKDAHNNSEKKEKLVFIDLIKEKDTYILTIKDNALGIEEKIINKLFEPYFTTKHQSQGTGIGLYMTNQIITKHFKGKILVSNEEFVYNNKKYKGACFKIILPI